MPKGCNWLVNGAIGFSAVMVIVVLALVVGRAWRTPTQAADPGQTELMEAAPFGIGDVASASSPVQRYGVFESAATKAPLGYCDHATTPQGVAPCELDPQTRRRYRSEITRLVNLIQLNWTAALNALQIINKLERGDIRYEQRLGQLLLGALHGVTSNGSAPLAPEDRAAFLKTLDRAASDWSDKIKSNLTQLFDFDLAALLVGLPPPSALAQKEFEKRIEHALQSAERDPGPQRRSTRR